MARLTRFVIACVLLLSALSIRAQGQAANGAPKFDAQKYEDQAKELMQQFQKPDFDLQQFGQQMRGLMQQFQEETKDMDPQEVEKIRQGMMDRLQPLIQQNMPTIIRRMQQGLMDSLKQQLECTDEEFAAIKPALQKVVDAMQTLGIGMGGGRRGRGFGGTQQPGQPPSELQKAKDDLHNTLADANASPSDIKFKLEALRLAKERAVQELALARNGLRSVLTIRQESILVANGILE